MDPIVTGALISGGIQTGRTLFGGSKKKADQRQINQQQKLTDMQVGASKNLADYEQELKMKMWHDTNYGAQLKQAEAAGVSKAHAIGGGGVGTGVGASVGSAMGGQADGASQSQMAEIQKNMVGAQIANLTAQTAKTVAETDNIKGIDRETKEFDLKFKIDGEIDSLRGIKAQTDKLIAEASKTSIEGAVAERTQHDEVTRIKAEAIGAGIMNEAMREGINVDKARAKEIYESIKQSWEKLEVEKRGQDISKENMVKLTETMLYQAGIQAVGNLANTIVDIKQMGGKTKTNTETVTYDKSGNSTGSRSQTVIQQRGYKR